MLVRWGRRNHRAATAAGARQGSRSLQVRVLVSAREVCVCGGEGGPSGPVGVGERDVIR